MALVRAGVGRETAHEVIKGHAVATALAMRAGAAENDLLDRLAADDQVPLTRADLEALLADPSVFVGAAERQVDDFVRRVGEVTARHPDAASYVPGAIL